MIFREQILLYSQAGALPPAQLEDIIDKTKALDMDQVRADIDKQSQEQDSKEQAAQEPNSQEQDSKDA